MGTIFGGNKKNNCKGKAKANKQLDKIQKALNVNGHN